MSVRWEFADADGIAIELWDHKLVRQETGEGIHSEQVALVLSYDEAFVIVGTEAGLQRFADRLARALRQLPETVEDEDEEEEEEGEEDACSCGQASYAAPGHDGDPLSGHREQA